MKRLANFSYYRLLIIALGLMLLLTSCEQFGLFNNPPTAEEIPSPGGFDPGMELSSKYLICPIIPNTAPVIPPLPYNEDLVDCALQGESAEIETWLTALELIANSCQAKREPNWAITLVSWDYSNAWNENLHRELNEVKTLPEDNPGIGSGAKGIEMRCPSYIGTVVSVPAEDGGSLYYTYTDWLKRISKNVSKYCTMVDELVKPLWLACDEINYYQDCQAPDPEEYHSIIELGMNDAQANYDSTVLFYIDTLQTDGWEAFRSSFSAASIDCPLDPQAPDTKFTFSQNAFCRKGPSSEYEEVATFLEGHVVQIKGRNHHEPRWWVIPNPGARGQCWVSDSTGAAEGPLEELAIVAAPPLVINKPSDGQSTTKTCSKDLGASDCAAAGGHMSTGIAQAPYCICP